MIFINRIIVLVVQGTMTFLSRRIGKAIWRDEFSCVYLRKLSCLQAVESTHHRGFSERNEAFYYQRDRPMHTYEVRSRFEHKISIGQCRYPPHILLQPFLVPLCLLSRPVSVYDLPLLLAPHRESDGQVRSWIGRHEAAVVARV